METATLGGGCFWCTEAIFKMLKGVTQVTSGYSGGNTKNPTHEQVSSSGTNHAETIQITFDPKIISYKDLLYVFFRTHDPTTPNRQGFDAGQQYRSVIFYHSKIQKKLAEKALKAAQKLYLPKIVTQIVPFKVFYKAEDYHQDYYRKNPVKPYCQLVIDPKIAKLRKAFKDLVKKNHDIS